MRTLKHAVLFAALWVLGVSSVTDYHRHHHRRSVPALLSKASNADIEAAHKTVEDALAESARLNKARLDHPFRNKYRLSPGSATNSASIKFRRDDQPPLLLNITSDIAAAAALMAEADAMGASTNTTNLDKNILSKRADFWMESISRSGLSPWGGDSSYKIYRNVQDYGAKGDGVTDDTAAIQKAIADGKRCGKGCNGSTTKHAIVYFPSGTYLVSSSIDVYFGTQLIGNANSWPIVKASNRFLGLGVFSTDKYTGNGAGADGKDNEWYINTANFYRQMRNFVIDISQTRAYAHVCALHYQVAQATSLQYIAIIANSSTTQRGIFAENGSGGVMSDITFTGGDVGLYGGSQQFTAQRLTFKGCKTAVRIIWDWGWLWKHIKVMDADVGFSLLQEKNADGSNKGAGGNIGSAAFMESSFTNVKQAIVIGKPSSIPGTGTTGLVLNNVHFDKVDKGVTDADGATILEGGSTVGNWVFGPVYDGVDRTWSNGSVHDHLPILPLYDVGGYFERARPQYEDQSTGSFVHLRDYATGDGSSDDTDGVQKALDSAKGKILFADAGIYLIKKTITIPEGSKIVGEAWTQFAATGDFFQDARNPQVMIQVGKQGDVGTVEMQDLLFTSKGPTPGAVLVQWNIKANKKGAAALWDCHARLGGATGTSLTPAECPALTNGEVRKECFAASLMMYIAPDASGYFDNMWLWVADHMIDDPDWNDDKNNMTMVSVYAARGLLIETQEATWLYGTASEHSVFYQYNFHTSQNIFAGLLQTESPYYQPKPAAPAPFESSVGLFDGDPKYDCKDASMPGCDSSWGLIIRKSQDVYIAAAGIYSWFSTYSEDCIDVHKCQNALINLEDNYRGVRIEQLITIGANNSFISSSNAVLSTDNLSVKSHPSWSQISLINVTSQGVAPDDSDENGSPDDFNTCHDNKWSTLEDLANAMGTFPEECAPLYALMILFKTLASTIKEYNDLNGDYDDRFNSYVKFTKEQIPYLLNSFMEKYEGPGNKYFSCNLQLDDNDESHIKPCPWSRVDLASYDKYIITYKLEDEKGFYSELEKTYGITPDWIKFGTDNKNNTCHSANCTSTDYTWRNFPMEADNINVTNPKDVINKAMPGYSALFGTLGGKYFDVAFGTWPGDTSDLLNVLSMPVSLAIQAVENMKQVAKIGHDYDEAEKKKHILEILSIVLLVIPFAGELIGPEAAGIMQVVTRVISLIGAVGNPALAFYEIANEPTSAPMEMLGLLVGGKGGGFGRKPKDMGKLGELRRGMKAEVLERMGAVFKKNNELIKKIGQTCRA